MKRGEISNLLRKLRLIQLADWLRYYVQKYRYRRINNEFRLKNPSVQLPPDYLMYETFQVNYQKYYYGGIDTAKWLYEHLSEHIELKEKHILDWGCGPGRIIRHLPDVINNGCEFYGSDYNERSIKWCSKNLSGITFHQNSLTPKLPFEDNSFDVIYGISVFTHLSEQMHYDWYQELHRTLATDGIMFLTTQGNNFKVKLTSAELKKYHQNELVVRGKTIEGHRTYSAFHPPEFMKKLFSQVSILEHIETQPENEQSLPQDIWIVRKNKL